MVQGILSRRTDLKLSVSCTTRPARPMEKEGAHYYFVSEREFHLMRERGEFLEWAEVHGNFYGTPRSKVEDQLESGRDLILEIDVQGAAQVKARLPEAILIFIEPPSMAVLEERLRRRQTEAEEEVQRRVADAYDELRKKHAFDGVFVNVDVGQCVQEVLQLIDKKKREDPI